MVGIHHSQFVGNSRICHIMEYIYHVMFLHCQLGSIIYKRFRFSSILLFSIWSAMTKHILYGDILRKSRKPTNANIPQDAYKDGVTADDTELADIATSLYPKLISDLYINIYLMCYDNII